MRFRLLFRGLAGYMPGLLNILRKQSGGTLSARYCYSVWLRHLVVLYKNGMQNIPAIVAEIGPGNTIGTGLCALLSGTKKYYGLDVVDNYDLSNNLEIFHELVSMFKNKTPIPDHNEFPNIYPVLDNYEFPSYILHEDLLQKSLDNVRIQNIINLLQGNKCSDDIVIDYYVPWTSEARIVTKSVELIYSQAVLEHIVDIKSAINAMHSWLAPKGYMSHQIDYSAHETHKVWNGHWNYKPYLWNLILRGRSYLINRLPNSAYISLFQNSGFTIMEHIPNTDTNGLLPEKIRNKNYLKYPDNCTIKNAHFILKKA